MRITDRRAGLAAAGGMTLRSRPRTPELKDGGSISIPGWHAHEDEASFRHVASSLVRSPIQHHEAPIPCVRPSIRPLLRHTVVR